MNKKGYVDPHEVVVVVMLMIVFTLLLGTLTRMVLSYPNQAELFNKQYGTQYSGWDFFYSGDLIRDYLHKGENKTHNIVIEDNR